MNFAYNPLFKGWVGSTGRIMTVQTPTLVPNSGRPPEDELDGILRAYFKAEMPDPWPSFEAPAPRNGLPLRRPQAPRFTLLRSRLALAAAILLLVVGAFFLFGGSTNHSQPDRAGLPLIMTGERDHLPTPGPTIHVGPDGARLEQELPLDLPMN
jgi:hypothetical protein